MSKNTTKKLLPAISLLTFLGLFFFLTNNVHAIEYQAQIGFGDFSGKVPIDGSSIGKYIKEIYKYSVGIVGILATIVIMWGGVRWLTAGGSQDAVKDAQEWIKGAVSGLVLILCSYFILNFVNPDLVNFRSIEIGKIEGAPTPGTTAESGIKATGVANDLTGLVSYKQCIDGNTTNCADIDRLKSGIISEAVHMSKESGLDKYQIKITSGCEGTPGDGIHSTGVPANGSGTSGYSHYDCNKIDISKTAAVEKYIKDTTYFDYKGIRNDGSPMYQNKETGGCYALEGDHADIAPQNCPPPKK